MSAIAQGTIGKQAVAAALTLSQFAQLAPRCGGNVAVSTLAAVAETESGLNPFSIHDNSAGTIVTPATAEEAASITSRLIAAGHSIDVGLMQINSMNFRLLGLTPEAALDPCRSIGAGAAILTEDYRGGIDHAQQQAALRLAISRYNTGDAIRGFTNGYVHRVELSNARVVPALDIGRMSSATPMKIASQQAPIAQKAANPQSWEIFPTDALPEAAKFAARIDMEPGPPMLVVNNAGPVH